MHRRDDGIVDLGFQCCEQRCRFVEPFLLVKHRREVAADLNIARPGGERAAQEMFGLAERAEQHGDLAQFGESLRLVGTRTQMGDDLLRRLFEASGVGERGGADQQRKGADGAADSHSL